MTFPIKIFALRPTAAFGLKIAEAMGQPLSLHEERDFEDGEHKTRPLVSLRECDVYVIHTLSSDHASSVNDKLCRLLFFIGALKDSGAHKVTAVVPYLCYARKDRKTKPRDPVTTRYLATLFEAVGTDRVVTLDVHNLQAFQNAFRCQSENLEAQHFLATYFASLPGQHDWVVMSPDPGGIKRAENFREHLIRLTGADVGFAFMEKYRSMDVVSGEAVAGAVKNKHVIILDDLISSGTTIARAAKACTALGAQKVYAAATHGIFSPKANTVLTEKALHKIIVTNTVPPLNLNEQLLKSKIEVLDISPLFAEVIGRLHAGNSLETIYENEPTAAALEQA